jgi:hypothetical protein
MNGSIVLASPRATLTSRLSEFVPVGHRSASLYENFLFRDKI